MAGGRGVALLVLLLSCWRQAGLQPVNVTSGPTEVPPSSKGQEDMPGVFDEILVQEMLDPKRSSPAGNQSTSALSTQLFKDRNAGVDEDFQVGGAQSYQGLSDNSQFFVGSDDKTLNNEPSTDESYQLSGPEGYSESQFSSGGKKLKTDQYKKISIVDKILQNSGKASGHTFR
ncbi:sperm acrosome-associated protein 7 isoform X3 [Suricata suricatta]|uniref:Sperm acrosome associated 7 n=1 Tax=Suricata suricatta TaxID=37032 RepID=A0A673UEZ5_SURSU|nr:sperm acrosome-associated protein 7 isoform X3 [Suricata suricatta]